LVERCGARPEDLEAVEVMMAGDHEQVTGNNNKTKYNKDIAAKRDRQRELNPSRLDKIVDEPRIQGDGQEFINSYDYYGDN